MHSSTIEDYIKCIYLEERRGGSGRVGTGRLAASLGLTAGSVSAMVRTLAESGLVTHEPYAGVALTAAGRKLAAHVLRRHRLIELLLVEVMGMDWSEVHDEAERLEHVVSDRLIERIDEMLGRPTADPHGDPIPTAKGTMPELDHPDLLTCPVDAPLRVARVLDQGPEFLRLADRAGLVPGRAVRVTARDEAADAVSLHTDAGDRVNLGFRAASKILVEPLR